MGRESLGVGAKVARQGLWLVCLLALIALASQYSSRPAEPPTVSDPTPPVYPPITKIIDTFSFNGIDVAPTFNTAGFKIDQPPNSCGTVIFTRGDLVIYHQMGAFWTKGGVSQVSINGSELLRVGHSIDSTLAELSTYLTVQDIRVANLVILEGQYHRRDVRIDFRLRDPVARVVRQINIHIGRQADDWPK